MRGAAGLARNLPLHTDERRITLTAGLACAQIFEVGESLPARPGTPVHKIPSGAEAQREGFEIGIDRALDGDLFERIVGGESSRGWEEHREGRDHRDECQKGRAESAAIPTPSLPP